LRREEQAGAASRRRVHDTYQAVYACTAWRSIVNRGEMNHRIRVIGEILKYRITQPTTNEVDTGIQVVVASLGDATNFVTGRQQTARHRTP